MSSLPSRQVGKASDSGSDIRGFESYLGSQIKTLYHAQHCRVAKLVRHLTLDQAFVGSSPTSAAIKKMSIAHLFLYLLNIPAAMKQPDINITV